MKAEKDPKCRCGTGYYCKVHLQYSIPPHLTESVAFRYAGAMTMDRIEECGGGRRVLRGEVGDR